MQDSPDQSEFRMARSQIQNNTESLEEIHSLYQDLFLTDIRQDITSVQQEIKQTKEDQNIKDYEIL